MTARVMFIAGEPSGDEHASHVIEQLHAVLPGVECYGVGGPLMERAGFTPLLPFAPFNRMGVVEVVANLAFFARARRFLLRQFDENPPQVLVLVDYAGFNIPMMRAARKRGILVLWYITPKVWAWKKGRARTLAQHANRIACILPFEPRYFEGHTAAVSYVGNPCVEDLDRKYGVTKRDRPLGTHKDGVPWRLALVPGSRPQEVARIFPSMAKAAAILKETHDVEVKASLCRGLDRSLFTPWLEQYRLEPHTGELDDLLDWAHLGIVTSGTATLQASLMGVPHVLVYKMSSINNLIYRLVVRFPFIGLPNIISDKEIVRECLQRDADPEPLAAHMARFIDDPEAYRKALEPLRQLREVLGSRYPSGEVASMLSSMLA